MASLRPTTSAAFSARCLLQSTTTTQSTRAFGTTPAAARQTPTHLKVPFEQVPDYPYGPFRWYKQRNTGLYGGAKIRFGNTVAEQYGNKARTHWKPNRQTKRLWSPALGMFVRTRLTTQVLKTVDKLGGIDEYLLGTKARRVKELGPAGWRLRWKVMQSPVVQERWAREREALGLPPRTPAADAEAAPSAEEISEIDAMLEREEEFVIGEPEEAEAQFMVEEPKSSAEQARDGAQDVSGSSREKQ
jgi:large subunit ribosomal protein L28